MNFEKELNQLKLDVKRMETVEELELARKIHTKKHWWTSIFITGLFYGLNGRVGKMLLGWLFGWTIIYPIYLIFKSYSDQKQFNKEMNNVLVKRENELKKIIDSEKNELVELNNFKKHSLTANYIL